MIYDDKRKKGIRSTFARNANLNVIAKRAIELFYQDYSPVSNTDVLLADSAGNVINPLMDNNAFRRRHGRSIIG